VYSSSLQFISLLAVLAAASPVVKRDTCVSSFTGKFQLSIGTSTGVGQITDGQPQGVAQISDGQPQGVTQISDGQPQAGVTQISDGQPQTGVSQITDGQVQVSQITDGQVQQQQPSVSQISDGQPQAGASVSQISDGQPQTGVSQISDGQPQAGASTSSSGTCAAGFLTLTLTNGQLVDSDGRFGYIASNTQFQFDNPVQAGGFGQNAWTLCSNNSLANQGSTAFWRCDSGAGFFNLYDTNYNPGACEQIALVIEPCT